MSRLWDKGVDLDQRVLQYTAGDDTRIEELLAVTGTDDVIDGPVVLLADETDRIAPMIQRSS